MRVVQLVKTVVGGSWALEQMRWLKRFGVDVQVVLPGPGPMVERYRDASIPVTYLDLDFLTLLKAGGKTRQATAAVLRDLGGDVIHSHFVQTTLSARLLLGSAAPAPRMFQIAGPLHLENVLTRTMDVSTASAPDYWIPACERSSELLRQAGVSPDRMSLIYHGLNPERFPARKAGALRAELGLAPDCLVIGMVAYMYRPKWYLGQTRGIKGHEDLIDAVARLPKPYDRAVCVCVGDAWDEPARAYAAAVKAYGKAKLGERAIFLGTRQDVLDLYPDFDVAVHPSHSENLGGAVESMMMMRPTIATRVGGFPDIVKPGVTGWLVPPKDPDALAMSIVDVLKNREGALSVATAARPYVQAKLGIEGQTRKLIAFYEHVLGRPARTKMSA